MTAPLTIAGCIVRPESEAASLLQRALACAAAACQYPRHADSMREHARWLARQARRAPGWVSA